MSHSTIQSQQIVVVFENKDPNVIGKETFIPIRHYITSSMGVNDSCTNHTTVCLYCPTIRHIFLFFGFAKYFSKIPRALFESTNKLPHSEGFLLIFVIFTLAYSKSRFK
jgi:hypothetical protein